MEIYIEMVEDAIKEYEKLIDETDDTKGYGLELRTAMVWDGLTDCLKNYIDKDIYLDLEKRWHEVVVKVYDNKNLCIC